MKKLTKILAVTGVVAGLGVSALPLGSYAALDPDDGIINDTTRITAHVVEAIALNAATNVEIGNGTSTITPGESGTGSFTVEVATNCLKGFKLSATGGDLTSTESNTIAPNASAAAGVEGWSIKGTEGKAGTTAKALSSTSQVLWTHAASNATIDDTETFTITVGTAATTEAGTYQGNIKFVAATVTE